MIRAGPYPEKRLTVLVNVLAKHQQRAFLVVEARAVSSAGSSLLVHMNVRMKNVPTSTLKLML